jgi:hypothetical protein
MNETTEKTKQKQQQQTKKQRVNEFTRCKVSRETAQEERETLTSPTCDEESMGSAEEEEEVDAEAADAADTEDGTGCAPVGTWAWACTWGGCRRAATEKAGAE